MVLNFQENISLHPYNTFGIEVKSKKFVAVDSSEALREALRQNQEEKLLVLGGGSNLLLTRDFDGLTLKIENKGMEILQEDDRWVTVKIAAGENWHDFVLWSLKNNWGGVENLALIPGSVGAAPIQNIGAYGVELKEVFVSCEALEIKTGALKIFSNADCEFGYRNSVFKQQLKGQFILLSVNLKLKKPPHPIHNSYRGLAEKLQGKTLNIQNIARAVIQIRTEKLPDPSVLGNGGSFFKNPVLSKKEFLGLKQKYPQIPHFKEPKDQIKIPAAWLIDQLGYKGYRKNDAGVHHNQALVMVNHGKASGIEIQQLALEIQNKVAQTFGIALAFEVNIL